MTYYRCFGYIRDDGRMINSVDTGGQRFEAIFDRRPTRCRYAVCGEWTFLKNTRLYVVFDLFDAKVERSPTARPIITPGKRWVYADLDTALAATILTYGGEENEG